MSELASEPSTQRELASEPISTAAPLRRPVLALAAVLATSFMSFFDFTVVYVAMPAIQDDMGTDHATVQWVAVGFALPFALLLITGGRLGDVLGHRRAFLGGLAGFTVFSGLAGVTAGIGLLALARALQGVAAAVLAPQALALFRTLVPAGKRGVAIAAYSATVGLATMSGPVLGGWLVDADLLGLGWRSIFLINVPLGVAALLGAAVALPADHPADRPSSRVDAAGIALSTAALLLLLCPLMYGQSLGWPWWITGALLAAAPATALLVAQQRRRARAGRDTLLALPLFALRAFNAGLAVNLVVASVLTGFLFVLAIDLQVGRGYGPGQAGATMAIAPAAMTVASIVAARVVGRLGRSTLQFGVGLVIAGFVVMGTAGQGGLVGGLVLFGLGTGLVSTSVLTMTMSAVPAGSAGSASGLFSTFRQVGAALGVTLNGAVYYAAALPATALFDAAVAVGMFALLLLVPRSAHAPAPAPASLTGSPS